MAFGIALLGKSSVHFIGGGKKGREEGTEGGGRREGKREGKEGWGEGGVGRGGWGQRKEKGALPKMMLAK